MALPACDGDEEATMNSGELASVLGVEGEEEEEEEEEPLGDDDADSGLDTSMFCAVAYRATFGDALRTDVFDERRM
jgi:hypothetical protein